jgi:hypothetical protein
LPETRIYGSFLLYWADKSVSWKQLLYIQETPTGLYKGAAAKDPPGIYLRVTSIAKMRKIVNNKISP